MRRLLFVATALSALSCGPKPSPANPTPANPAPAPPPPLPPSPPGRADGAIRLGPSALRYVMHQIIHIDQEFQGIRQPLDFGLRAFFAVTILGPADTSGYPTTITIDSIVAARARRRQWASTSAPQRRSRSPADSRRRVSSVTRRHPTARRPNPWLPWSARSRTSSRGSPPPALHSARRGL